MNSAKMDPQAGHRKAAAERRESRDCSLCRAPNVALGIGVPVRDYYEPLRGCATVCRDCIEALRGVMDDE